MAWPPPTLSTSRSNATPQQNTHAADHNAANLAINDLVGMVQYHDSQLIRRGFAGSQSGQTIASGAVVTMGFNGIDPAWGPGAGGVFTVPAGQGGAYVCTLEITGPIVQSGAAGDIGIVLNGVQHVGYVPAGKGRGISVAQQVLNPGMIIYTSIYNPTLSAAFYAGSIHCIRYST